MRLESRGVVFRSVEGRGQSTAGGEGRAGHSTKASAHGNIASFGTNVQNVEVRILWYSAGERGEDGSNNSSIEGGEVHRDLQRRAHTPGERHWRGGWQSMGIGRQRSYYRRGFGGVFGCGMKDHGCGDGLTTCNLLRTTST